jgi:myosin heavy subunit
MYKRLVDWIVFIFNQANSATAKKFARISILDIFGFHAFELNYFDEFSVNFACEKMHVHFKENVFKWQMADYIREGIDTSNMKMPDIHDNCVELMEKFIFPVLRDNTKILGDQDIAVDEIDKKFARVLYQVIVVQIVTSIYVYVLVTKFRVVVGLHFCALLLPSSIPSPVLLW